MMQEDQFLNALHHKQSLLFHGLKSQNQLKALHEIFTGERLLTEKKGPCITFAGHITCTASHDQNDMPFTFPRVPPAVPSRKATGKLARPPSAPLTAHALPAGAKAVA